MMEMDNRDKGLRITPLGRRVVEVMKEFAVMGVDLTLDEAERITRERNGEKLPKYLQHVAGEAYYRMRANR